MLRAVLAVAIAAALLAVSLPPIDAARRDNADSAMRRTLEHLETVTENLERNNDPVPVGSAGATRTVTVRIPARGWHGVEVTRVTIGGLKGADAADTNGSDVFGWRLRGGPRHVLRVDRVDIHAVAAGTVLPDDRPLVLGEPGRHVLELRLVRLEGNPVVLVRRFKPENGPIQGRARTPRRRARTHGRPVRTL